MAILYQKATTGCPKRAIFDFYAIFLNLFKFLIFIKLIGVFLCEESIARIAEPWKPFPDSVLALKT
jgi:hypothetical protein